MPRHRNSSVPCIAERAALRMLDREKLVEAVENLRTKLIRLAILLGALTALGYWQAPVATLLQQPNPGAFGLLCPREAFLTNVKLGFCAAVFILAPVIFFLIWDAFAFYVTPYSRRYAVPVVVAASFLFIGGTYLCYALVLPFGLTFLMGFGGG